MKRYTIMILTIMSLLLAATQVAAQDGRTWNELDDVRLATGPYHPLDAAIADGFVPFDLEGGDTATCFEGEDGGMGVHYVRHIDEVVDVTDPEAMVYELTPDGAHRLVGVEYIVPQEIVEDADGNVVSPPIVLGHELHKHSFLPVYILHAWVWEKNPAGLHADFNPNVGPCPARSIPRSGGV